MNGRTGEPASPGCDHHVRRWRKQQIVELVEIRIHTRCRLVSAWHMIKTPKARAIVNFDATESTRLQQIEPTLQMHRTSRRKIDLDLRSRSLPGHWIRYEHHQTTSALQG